MVLLHGFVDGLGESREHDHQLCSIHLESGLSGGGEGKPHSTQQAALPRGTEDNRKKGDVQISQGLGIKSDALENPENYHEKGKVFA